MSPPDAFRAEVARGAALPDWIVDRNCIDTITPRLAAADTLIDRDVPSRLGVARIHRRARVRLDAAAGRPERISLDVLRLDGRSNRAWDRAA